MYNTEGCDYDPEPYNATFPAGVVRVKFNFSIIDDNMFERDETFDLIINHPTLPDRIERIHPYASRVTVENDDERKWFV